MSLIVAGESIFLLPFVLARIFRPTFLDIFNITNLQLGTAFSVYGVIAMVSYFAGGPLADRFSSRHLIIAALLVTSAGGLLMATIPPVGVLTLLYGFWGITTIFLFWGALIKTTRELGGTSQGRTFGLLDGGRGLFAALLAFVSVSIFAALLPLEVESATLPQRSAALGRIILIFSGLGVFSALLVWWFVPARVVPREQDMNSHPQQHLHGLNVVGKLPTVWLQAVIILCAYVAYKSTDDFSLYARDAFGYNDVEAAWIGTVSFWMRPLAAISAGLLADRFNVIKALLVSFAIVMAGSLSIASGVIQQGMFTMLLLVIAGTSSGIYALRALYFAIFREARVPLMYCGAAVGLVSFIGYTPDVFMGPLMGFLLDSSPGATGHQHVFFAVFLFALAGFVATLWFRREEQRLGEKSGDLQ